MTYSRESVYTYVRNAILAAESGTYVTARREPIPKNFPAVWLVEMNRVRTERFATLANDDDQYQSTFEVQIYSNKQNGALEEAYKILDAVERAFKKLAYFETFCEQMTNADPSVFRVVARFAKQIGLGDILPESN